MPGGVGENHSCSTKSGASTGESLYAPFQVCRDGIPSNQKGSGVKGVWAVGGPNSTDEAVNKISGVGKSRGAVPRSHDLRDNIKEETFATH